MKKLHDLLASDTRITDRVYFPLPLFYKSPSDAEWKLPLAVNDISGGGLQFHSSEKIAKASVLAVKIELPDKGKPIECKATVMWCNASPHQHSYHMGIKFSKMDDEDRRRYVTFICENILKKYANKD